MTNPTPPQKQKLDTAAAVLGEDPSWLTTLFELNIISVKDSLGDYAYMKKSTIYSFLSGASSFQGLQVSDALKDPIKNLDLLFPVETDAISKKEISYLSQDPLTGVTLEKALTAYLEELGLRLSGASVSKSNAFSEKSDVWVFKGSSYDKLTAKVLSSLIAQDKRELAENLLGELEDVIAQYRENSTATINRWNNVVYETSKSILG